MAGNRASYVRAVSGGAPIEEWFLNGPLGLEHGFTLPVRPPRKPGQPRGARLVLEMVVEGDVRPRASAQGAVALQRDAGVQVGTYGDLWVEDADHKEVPARLVVQGRKILISVDDSQARYPLQVDPLVIFQQKLNPLSEWIGSQEYEDYLGHSVSVSGDVAVAGAPGDSKRGKDAGAAYVYARSGTQWSPQQQLTASDGAAYDYFGWSVSVSGDVVAVGASDDDDRGDKSGSAYVFSRSGTVWSEQQKLTASDGAAEDFFGESVSVSGDTVTAGARGDDGLGKDSGSAYVFGRSGTVWSEQGKLTASDGAVGDVFGSSVSASGDVFAVGAYGDDDRGGESGSAYVFIRSGTAWSEQQKLTASDGAADDQFGLSVSVSGDTVSVGAYGDDDRGGESGSAYVFIRSGTAWSEQQKLTASDGAAMDRFGVLVSVSGDTAVAGAVLGWGHNSYSGSAYVFARSGTVWSEAQKLTAPDCSDNDHFGISVSVSGDTVMAGASEHDQWDTDAGAVYMYSRSGTTWGQQQKPTFLEHKPVSSQAAGYSVSISGDTSVVGAPQDPSRAIQSGSAHVYIRSGTSWKYQHKLTASDGAADDQFGLSVSVSGDVVAVGAPFDDDRDSGSGSAYMFSRSGTVWSEQQKLTASDGTGMDYFGWSVSVSGDTVTAGAPDDDDRGSASGSAYVFIRSGAVWSQQQKLTASDGAAIDHFGTSVSVSGDTVVGGIEYGFGIGGSSDSAYVFTRNGTLWSEQAKLTASDCVSSGRFGISVSVSGDIVVAGADADDGHASASGSAYVFARSGTVWSKQQKLTAPDGASDDLFGHSVSVSGEVVAVGAPGASGSSSPGWAYTFERSGTTWSQLQKLTAADGADDDYFGWSVSIHGTSILVGADGHCLESKFAGAAYVYGPPNPNGTACTTSSSCASGLCVDKVCCDKPCGVGVATDCQACSTVAGAAINGTCGPASTSITCRVSSGACDAAENCDGTTTACPADGVQPTTKECRAAAGACDVAETCDGSTKACPADGVQPTTKECRAAAGDCDAAETCDGSTTACPADGVQPTTHTCRAAGGVCDVAETCDGSTKACPADAVQPITFVCRGSSGLCDVAETCDGAATACPADGVQPTTKVCRAAAGVCDAAEKCDGSGVACPADGVAATTKVCRAKADLCDVAETCDGTAKGCPGEVFAAASTVCRAPAGQCDAAEQCSGTLPSCPKDVSKPDGTPCLGGAGLCSGGKCLLKPDAGVPDAGPDAFTDGLGDGAADALAEAGTDGSPDTASGMDQKMAGDTVAAPDQAPKTDGAHKPDPTSCSCEVGAAPSNSGPSAILLSLALLALALRRRRTRK